jgi:hypothetical protein
MGLVLRRGEGPHSEANLNEDDLIVRPGLFVDHAVGSIERLALLAHARRGVERAWRDGYGITKPA